MPKKRQNFRKTRRAEELARWYRRAADLLSKSDARAVRDYAFTCIAAGIEPLPVTAEQIELAYQYLIGQGGLTARTRMLAWRRALDRLDADTRERAGIHESLRQPRGVRTLNAPCGTFPVLEKDCAAVVEAAIKPRENIADPHEPVSASTGRQRTRSIQVMATILLNAGKVDRTITLRGMLAVATQTAFIELVDQREEDDDPIAWLEGYLEATVFFATRVGAQPSAEALFAKGQLKYRGGNSEMTEGYIEDLNEFLKRDKVMAWRRRPRELIEEARELLVIKRQKWREAAAMRCNIAAVLALQSEVLFKTYQFCQLEFDQETGRPIQSNVDGGGLEPFALSTMTLNILADRKHILAELGLSSEKLMAGWSGKVVTEQTLVVTVGRMLEKSAIAGMTLKSMRDVGAILLLRDDPRAIRRVAVLLGMKQARTVSRRYAPFLRAPK